MLMKWISLVLPLILIGPLALGACLGGCSLQDLGFSDEQAAQIQEALNAYEGDTTVTIPDVGEVGLKDDPERGWGFWGTILGASLFWPIIGRPTGVATKAVTSAIRAVHRGPG